MFAADVRPAPLLGVLVVVGVPAAAVLVSLAALRRVVAEPLGVVRDQGAPAPPAVVAALLPVVGLAALAPDDGEDEDAVPDPALALGIIALLWASRRCCRGSSSASSARLGAGKVAWQLAVRRLQLDPGGAARAVAGIAVAVAGAIALQMVFTAPRRASRRTRARTRTVRSSCSSATRRPCPRRRSRSGSAGATACAR